jgi:glycosyltransferase involved in cell wall biosynthesis/SAM-dependent methyltransferase
MTALVSIVVPCFNLGPYLDEAVQSVLDQTFQDFEIVIVDDGSDDPATRQLFASYRRPKTRVLRTENQGVARARNLGLEHATGSYVSFLDADDLFERAFLERTVEALEENPSLTFASCWLRAFGAADFEWKPRSCDFPDLLAEDTVCTAALMRRDVLLSVGGFDPGMPVAGYEDWELAIRIVERGAKGLIVPEFLFRYRARAGSMTEACTAPHNHMRLFEYIVDKHLETYRVHHPGVMRVVSRRTSELERFLSDPPPRPSVGRNGAGWRAEVTTLERHRRMLQECIPSPSAKSPPSEVEWGSLRRLEPVSRVWGLDRGIPVDRHYIDRFLARHRDAITGRLLEVKDADYTNRFGADVAAVDVVDIASENPAATLIADLAEPESLPPEQYDCFVLTQTMHVIYDCHAVIRNAFRTMRPGGVLLATLPCVSRIDYESGVEGDYWRFTPASARRMFEEIFGAGHVQLATFGNLLACTAFLQGLAAEELTSDELDRSDPYFPLLVGVRAEKEWTDPPAAAQAPSKREGFHDAATCRSIIGWAWDRANPDRRLSVDVWCGDRLLGSTAACRYRHDLENAGKGDGRVAFRLVPPSDGHDCEQPIRVTVSGTDWELPNSPRPPVCVCELGRSNRRGL